MIRRFELRDKDKINELIGCDPQLYILFNALYNQNILEFNIFVCESSGSLSVLMKFGMNIYIKTDGKADIEEISSFLNMMGEKCEIYADDEDAVKLSEYLSGITKSENYYLAGLNTTPMRLSNDALYKKAEGYNDLLKIYKLLCDTGMIRDIDFDNFYLSRIHLINKRISRSLYIPDCDMAVCTASTMVETDNKAFLYAVATHENYRGRGMATNLVSNLANILLNEGKECFISFRSKEAQRVYEKIGFKTLKQKTVLYFN